MSEERRLKLISYCEGLEFKQTTDGQPGSEGYWVLHRGSDMFVLIKPGGTMYPHVDTTFHHDKIRLHHVLLTNDKALNYVGDEVFNLSLGGIYELEAAKTHWADNQGDTDRLHYVLF